MLSHWEIFPRLREVFHRARTVRRSFLTFPNLRPPLDLQNYPSVVVVVVGGGGGDGCERLVNDRDGGERIRAFQSVHYKSR